jgi:Exostosin family/Glycosyl transferase family 8
MFSFIPNELFITKTDVVYPPFKNGLYMEEYFMNYMTRQNITIDKQGRRYIPALWTNFQISSWFQEHHEEMQRTLDKWISENPSSDGYFIVVQYDDGPLLRVPPGTLIYGGCSGNVVLPLIYQDLKQNLENIPKKTFKNKPILCSFVGSITHNVRNVMIETYQHNPRFKLLVNNGWTNQVSENNQTVFVDITVNSKFALAPRGYGRSSFRFFEIFKLGTIPVYIWDDTEWLPYKNVLDYDKFCISIHISEIDLLEELLLSINEKQYDKMFAEYEKIKHMFELDYMCEYICGPTTEPIQEATLGIGKGFIDNVVDTDTIQITFETEPSPKPQKVLLVAIAIGQHYLQQYNSLFKTSHENYAKKCGYDFKVITEYLDKKICHVDAITFNKTLVCSQEWSKQYDFIVLVDADVLININSPPIHTSIDFNHYIGIVNEYSQPTSEIRLKIQQMMGWEPTAKEYYKLAQLNIDTEMVFNTGVMVFQPKIHSDFLDNIYNTYVSKCINHPRRYHYEQSCIGYELQKQQKYKLLQNKWNVLWSLYKLTGAQLEDVFKQNYFIHFAGNTDLNRVMDLQKLNK